MKEKTCFGRHKKSRHKNCSCWENGDERWTETENTDFWICLILFVITNVRCKLHLWARRNLSSNLPSKKSSYKSRRRQVMDLEANKLIFHPKKSPEKVDSRWWQMEDVNKYLRKKGERIGQKVGGGVKRRRHGVRDWRRKQIFHQSLRRMTRLGGPQMELDTLLNCD